MFVVICLTIFGAHMNIIFIIKVKIILLINWPLIEIILSITLTIGIRIWLPTYHSNIGVQTSAMFDLSMST